MSNHLPKTKAEKLLKKQKEDAAVFIGGLSVTIPPSEEYIAQRGYSGFVTIGGSRVSANYVEIQWTTSNAIRF